MSDKTGIQWTQAIIDRFWSYVEKTDSCWNWTGGTFNGRYGQFRVGKKKMRSHRVAWLLVGNSIPDSMILCHKCDNVKCVRPDHIFIGTHADNARDRELKGRGARNNTHRFPGERNPSAKLKRIQVDEIRQRISDGEQRKDLAAEFNVSKSTIHMIARREIWQ